MRILVLDSIHGGKVIADHLSIRGHVTDLVDVYRNQEGISPDLARSRVYDLIIAPVHLDPDYSLLQDLPAPVISHHAAVRWLFTDYAASPVI
ncbi:MAG: coenzyme F430 synthase, partial [Methanospirillum hungatei]|nr:coenzyme F430 synthase [Methanospirillum hungatei]